MDYEISEIIKKRNNKSIDYEELLNQASLRFHVDGGHYKVKRKITESGLEYCCSYINNYNDIETKIAKNYCFIAILDTLTICENMRLALNENLVQKCTKSIKKT
jgi:hypothetical protein